MITAHLNGTAPVSWCGLNFDFAGAVFDGGDFSGAKLSGGTVNFTGAEFSGGTVSFSRAEFSSETVDFAGAEFSGGTVDFSRVASWTQPRTLAQVSICPIHRPVSCCRQLRALHPIALYREKKLVTRRIRV